LPKNGYLRYDDMAEKLPENDLLTQTEVAKYLRVVDATVKNYRERGLLKFFQAPGSSRIQYYRDDVIRFLRENTFNDKGGGEAPKKAVVKGKPVVSAGSDYKDWRI
jgi:hypothetical protein